LGWRRASGARREGGLIRPRRGKLQERFCHVSAISGRLRPMALRRLRQPDRR